VDLSALVNKIVENCSAFLRRHIFTRENVWVLLVSLMLLLIIVLGTMGVQPRFVYSGF
jgi:hypothetical protein